MMAEKETLRVAGVADVHAKKTAAGTFQAMFSKASEQADVILLCGDLTDYGAVEEAKVLAKEITSSLRIPAIVGLKQASGTLETGEYALLDGFNGVLIIKTKRPDQ